MADDQARSEHYATQAVLGAAVRLVAALDPDRVRSDDLDRERADAEAGLREAVRLWQVATGGQVVVTRPPARAVPVRPGDTLVVSFPDPRLMPRDPLDDLLWSLRSALDGIDVVMFAGTIHDHTRPDEADEPGPMPRLEDVERQDPDFPRG